MNMKKTAWGLPLNLVELVEDGKPAPCKWGNIIENHSCYCHHEEGPRKCPVWRNGLPWSKKSCSLFAKRGAE